MGHMVTVEEAKGKRARVRGKAFFSLPENFFLNLKSEGGVSYIVPGADTLLSLFLMKPD